MGAYVQQRSIEYDLLTPTNVAPSGTTILTWDSGPNLNYTPPGEVVWSYQNGTGYLNSAPWPNPIATPTDHITLPDNGPYLIEAGCYCQITANGSTSGTVYFEVYDRTADAVLDSNTISIFAIGTFIYTITISPGPDPNVLNGVAGHQICLRVRNTSNVTVQMSPGGIYTDWFAARELSHSVDPANTLPYTTTPQVVPIQVLSTQGIAALNLLSGSALITHPNSTTETYSNTSPTSFFNVNIGDTILMSSDGRGYALQDNGSSTELAASTSYKLVTAQDLQPGGITSIVQEIGTTFNRVGKLLDGNSTNQITTPSVSMFDRDTVYQVVVDGSGNTIVSVMDGHVQVGT